VDGPNGGGPPEGNVTESLHGRLKPSHRVRRERVGGRRDHTPPIAWLRYSLVKACKGGVPPSVPVMETHSLKAQGTSGLPNIANQAFSTNHWLMSL
jgi:hypothetical protein